MRGVHKFLGVMAFAVAICLSRVAGAEEAKLPQRLLYVGHRSTEFVPFLKEHFASVEDVSRESFKPEQGDKFDVVLLDWPQNVNDFIQKRKVRVPLGERENWHRPTVLIGSAGLNLAVAWKLKGGAGCTCLAPVAYGMKANHEIFKTPIAINVTATTNIPTPEAFVSELKTERTDVLPLVDGITRYETVINDQKRGWCTYFYEFADAPEAEYFCGGINEKTPRASAVWRRAT